MTAGIQRTLSRMRTQYRRLADSKNIRELFLNIPWVAVEYLALIPALLMMLVPVYYFIVNQFIAYAYQMAVDTIYLLCNVSLAVIAVIVCGKLAAGRYSLRAVISSHLPFLFFGAFVLLMLLSTAVNGYTEYAKHGVSAITNEGLFTHLRYILFFFGCTALISKKRLKSLLIHAFLASHIFLALAFLYDEWVHPVQVYVGITRNAAVFCDSNYYGYYLTVAVMLSCAMFVVCAEKRLKCFYFVTYVLGVAVLLINNTLGAFVAVFAALVFQCIALGVIEKRLNRLAVLSLIVFVMLAAFMGIWYQNILSSIASLFIDLGHIAANDEEAKYAGTNRWLLWTWTVRYIREKPLLGHGTDGIADRLWADTDGIPGSRRPHNEVLQWAAFHGIPAAVMYVCGVVGVMLHGWRLAKRQKLNPYMFASLMAAAGYFASSMFGLSVYNTAPYFFIFLGLGFSAAGKYDGKR